MNTVSLCLWNLTSIAREKTLKQIKQFQALKKVDDIKLGPDKNRTLPKVFDDIREFGIQGVIQDLRQDWDQYLLALMSSPHRQKWADFSKETKEVLFEAKVIKDQVTILQAGIIKGCHRKQFFSWKRFDIRGF